MGQMSLILLVDDNKMDIELTLDAFKMAHIKNPIQIANDGEEALNYLFGREEYSDREKYPIPDIILLDLKMPKVDGFEVLRQIKKVEILKRIPVIILTSSKEEGDRALSYDNGANSYLVKPVSFDGFLSVVEKIVQYWLILNVSPPKD
jgi:CheY-like chemotaxis protein